MLYIQQKGVTKKGNAFGSHKYTGKSAPCYKLGIDILKGSLCWLPKAFTIKQRLF